jgi:ribose transport system substrate-binding protein
MRFIIKGVKMPKNSRLAAIIGGACIAAVALAGCGSAASSQNTASSQTATGKKRIVLVLNNQFDPFYLTLIQGAEEEAKKRNIDFSWQAPAEQSAANQIQVLQSAAATKPDGIIFSAADKEALAVPLKSIFDARTPVITVDTDVSDPTARLMSVKSDGRENGELAAKTANDMLTGQGKVGYLGYTPGVESIDIRLQGWNEALKSYPSLENVGDQYAGLDTAENQNKASALLARTPDLNAIYASWGGACVGASQAVQQAGKTDQVKVICADAAPDQVSLLKSGDVSALVVQKAKEMGATAVSSMLDYLETKQVPDNILLTHSLATSKNAADPSIETLFYVNKDQK